MEDMSRNKMLLSRLDYQMFTLYIHLSPIYWLFLVHDNWQWDTGANSDSINNIVSMKHSGFYENAPLAKINKSRTLNTAYLYDSFSVGYLTTI
jgi:hypothetical protein